MSDYLLDTNVLIRCLRGIPESAALLRELQASSDLYVSVLSRLEIFVRMWPQEEKHTLQLLSSLISLPVDQAVGDAAGHLLFRQARQGVTLSVADAIIAATAMRHGLTVVTYDKRHLGQIPDLRVHDIAT